MRKFVLAGLLVFTTCLFSGFQQAENPATNGYQIRFKVNGLKDTVCFLAHYYGDKQYLDDTATVDSKGNFVFEGNKKLPGGIYLVVLPGKQYFEIIIEEQFFSMETDMKDYVPAMKVKGSKENEVFYNYLRFVNTKGMAIDSLKIKYEKVKDTDKTQADALRKKMESIDKEVVTYRNDFNAKYPWSMTSKLFKTMEDPVIPEMPTLPSGKKDSTFPYRYYKQHYWDNIDLSDDRLIRTPIFHGKLEKYFKSMVLQLPDSITKEADYVISKTNPKGELFKYCVWWVTNHYETSQIMGMDGVFVHMAEKYYLSGKAYWVEKSVQDKIRDRVKILKPLLLGEIIPNVDMQDSTGKSYKLHQIKAKYTVLFFYDPGCGHCQKATPKLYEWYQANKAKRNVEVYCANIERNEKEWKSFIVKNQLKWINVYDPNRFVDFRGTYDVYSTPVMYILDAQKKIIAKRLGVEQIDEFFQKIDK